MIFWCKIVIFHTKYPKNVRASLRSAQFFKVHPPNLKSSIRPCYILMMRLYYQNLRAIYRHSSMLSMNKLINLEAEHGW